MEIQFPDIPLYKGWGHPYRVEATIRGLELVEGHLPRKSKEPCCAADPIASIRRSTAPTSSSMAKAWCTPFVSRAGRWIT